MTRKSKLLVRFVRSNGHFPSGDRPQKRIRITTQLGIWVSLRTELGQSVSSGSVQFSRSVLSDSVQTHGLQQARPPCPLPTPGVYSNLCPLSRGCHPTISSSVTRLSSSLQSFPASGSFQMSQFFTWPKYWSFSFNISRSSGHLGLISIGMNWLDILPV